MIGQCGGATAPTAPMTAPSARSARWRSDYADDCAVCASPVGGAGAVARSRGQPGAVPLKQDGPGAVRCPANHTGRTGDCNADL